MCFVLSSMPAVFPPGTHEKNYAMCFVLSSMPAVCFPSWSAQNYNFALCFFAHRDEVVIDVIVIFAIVLIPAPELKRQAPRAKAPVSSTSLAG